MLSVVVELTLSACSFVWYWQGSTTVHCASGGGNRPSNGTVASSVVRSTATGIPASERAAIAPRRRRRKFFNGMRTVCRQIPCSERLRRTRAVFSTLPEGVRRPYRKKRSFSKLGRPLPHRRGRRKRAYPPPFRAKSVTSTDSDTTGRFAHGVPIRSYRRHPPRFAAAHARAA